MWAASLVLWVLLLSLTAGVDTVGPVFELPASLAYIRARVFCQWFRHRPADLVQAMVDHLELLLASGEDLQQPTLPFLDGWQAWLSRDVQPNAALQPIVEGVLSSSSLREGLVTFFNAGKSGAQQPLPSGVLTGCRP